VRFPPWRAASRRPSSSLLHSNSHQRAGVPWPPAFPCGELLPPSWTPAELPFRSPFHPVSSFLLPWRTSSGQAPAPWPAPSSSAPWLKPELPASPSLEFYRAHDSNHKQIFLPTSHGRPPLSLSVAAVPCALFFSLPWKAAAAMSPSSRPLLLLSSPQNSSRSELVVVHGAPCNLPPWLFDGMPVGNLCCAQQPRHLRALSARCFVKPSGQHAADAHRVLLFLRSPFIVVVHPQ
jgi:hypothetical protein